MPGADRLQRDERILALLRRCNEHGRLIAAICAAPAVLARAGVLDGRTATSFPGFLDPLAAPGIEISDQPVVSDGHVVTSRGPGTAMDFALVLVERLKGRAARDQVEERLQRPRGAAAG
jgi:4-methyl-5(b-hydroxyethyl)-thiazole monophosphate biosynthesis